MSTGLDDIIRMATFAADLAVIDQPGRVPADDTRTAVDAAIRSAVANGLLAATDAAAARMEDGFEPRRLA